MPSSKPTTHASGLYSNENLEKAIKSVVSGQLSQSEAYAQYNVSRSTLYRRIKERLSCEVGQSTACTDVEEEKKCNGSSMSLKRLSTKSNSHIHDKKNGCSSSDEQTVDIKQNFKKNSQSLKRKDSAKQKLLSRSHSTSNHSEASGSSNKVLEEWGNTSETLGIFPSENNSEHFNFVQAAAKPTQLYMYLAERSHTKGSFLLRRTLSYMKTPSHKKTVDRSLEQIVSQLNHLHKSNIRDGSSLLLNETKSKEPHHVNNEIITLSIERFLDKKDEKEWFTVEGQVSVYLVEVRHDRRKGSTKYLQKRLLQASPLPCSGDMATAIPNGTSTESSKSDNLSRILVQLDNIMKDIENSRIADLLLCLRVQGYETKRLSKLIETDAKRNGTVRKLEKYPVFYEGYLPLIQTGNSGERKCLLQSGQYHLRMDVDYLSFASSSSNLVTSENPGSSFKQQISPYARKPLIWQTECGSELQEEYSEWPSLKFRVSSETVSLAKFDNLIRQGETHQCDRSVTSKSNRRSPSKLKRNSHPSKEHVPSNGDSKSGLPFAVVCDSSPDPDSQSQSPSMYLPVAYYFYHSGKFQQYTTHPHPICPFCFTTFNLPVVEAVLEKISPRSKNKRKKVDPRLESSKRVNLVLCKLRALILHLKTFHSRFCVVAQFAPEEEILSFVESANINGGSKSATTLLVLRISVCHQAIHVDNDFGLRSEANFHQICLGKKEHTARKSLIYRPRHRTIQSFLIAEKSMRMKHTTTLLHNVPCTACQFGADESRRYVSLPEAHTRKYFYTWTSQAKPEHHDMSDSEDEEAQPWLVDLYSRNVMEFTDVNEAEKVLMKAWNTFLLENPCLSDERLFPSLKNFILRFASTLHEHGLRTNVLLHLNNLLDYGLLSPEQLCYLMIVYENTIENCSFIQKTNDESPGSPML